MNETENGAVTEEQEAVGNAATSDEGPGQMLRALREEQGLSQSEVAEALHLTVHYINALEEGNYEKLPGRVFIKGYLRAYANHVGADSESIQSSFESRMASQEESRQEVMQAMARRRSVDQSVFWLTIAGLIIVLVVGLSWWFFGRGTASSSSVTSQPASPAVEVNEDRNAARRGELTEANGEEPRPPLSTAAGENRNPAGAGSSEADEPGMTEEGNPSETELTPPLATAGEQSVAVSPTALMEASDAASEASPETQESSGNQPATSETPEESSSDSGGVAEASDTNASATTEASEEETGTETTQEDENGVSLVREERSDGTTIRLTDEGNDELILSLAGTSWVEVDNGEQERLFNDILRRGDELRIRSQGPFDVLLGDARQVDMRLNEEHVSLDSSIRNDNSARIILEP